MTCQFHPLPTPAQQIRADGWSPARQREYVEWSMKAAALCNGLSPELDRLYAERASAMKARCP